MACAQILLVAAEGAVARELRPQLEGLGFGVQAVVPTAAEALDRANADPPDLLLMDARADTPALEQVRQQAGVPILLLADGSQAPSPGPSAAGVHCLARPFGEEELAQAVRRALAGGRTDAKDDWARTVLGSIPEGLIATDADGRVTYMNPLAEALTGWSRDQAAGRPRQEVFALRDDAEAGQGTGPWLIPREGPAVRVAYRTAPIQGPGGQIAGQVLIAREAPEPSPAAGGLTRLQKTQTVGRVAGGVAHHFNNLLTVIIGNAQLLRGDPMAISDLNETVDQILAASRQAAELTSRLLALARTGPRQVETVDLHEAVADVADVLAKTTNRRVRIHQDLQARCALARGDANQIRSALMHLGLNACDAMPEGGELTFATRDAAADTSAGTDPVFHVELTVQDTGVGMSPEVLDQAFDPFFTTKQAASALGMGLPSVVRCVQDHQGTLDVTSDPGRGTTVKLLVPTLGPPAATQARPPKPAKGAARGHILVVDDEPAVVSVARKILQRAGYTVSVCGDGDGAVRFYKKHHKDVDLVILDLIMPDMDGREAFVKMKAIDPKVRAVLSSGYSRNDMPKSILEDGVLGFLPKPYDVHDLPHAVGRFLPS